MDFMYELPSSTPGPDRKTEVAMTASTEIAAKPKKRSNNKRIAYSQELAMKICQRISEGELIAEIVRDEYYPMKSTIYGWLHEHEDFARAYALAKQCYAEDKFDETISIADQVAAKVDTVEDDGRHNARIQAARLQIDARFRQASMLAPKKYSTRAVDPPLPQVIQGREEEDVAAATGEGAKLVNPAPANNNVTALETHPLYESIKAWREAAAKTSK